MSEFKSFPAIARWSKAVVITEKIDGTNALVYVPESLDEALEFGSRNRWIVPGDDNAGFAAWGVANAEELRKLGPGYHYGEWWGAGIGRRYGLSEKRFSLFNTHRWSDAAVRPACCDVVPVILQRELTTNVIDEALDILKHNGSLVAPGFMDPEGIVLYHTASGTYYKKTFEKDSGKGQA